MASDGARGARWEVTKSAKRKRAAAACAACAPSPAARPPPGREGRAGGGVRGRAGGRGTRAGGGGCGAAVPCAARQRPDELGGGVRARRPRRRRPRSRLRRARARAGTFLGAFCLFGHGVCGGLLQRSRLPHAAITCAFAAAAAVALPPTGGRSPATDLREPRGALGRAAGSGGLPRAASSALAAPAAASAAATAGGGHSEGDAVHLYALEPEPSTRPCLRRWDSRRG